MAKKPAFVTLKDHKKNFPTNPSCRLINPAKSELGRASKVVLDRINNAIMCKSNTNLWRNTRDVLKWFNNIPDKSASHFICFDVVDFYPSITEQTLTAALAFASKYTNISEDEKRLIMHTKTTLLYHNESTWRKATNTSSFDVAMGSFDGAETCELVGCLILSELSEQYGHSIGLYRDDGLACFNKTTQVIERIKKDICTAFKKYNLRVTVDANLKVVDFLDVTLDLNTGKHKPFIKPNNKPTYVHSQSNHPPSILKNLPAAINKRLSEISSDAEIFNQAAPIYQQALNASGYSHQLKYQHDNHSQETDNKKRNRRRNIIWYNPPFNQTLKSNLGKQFLTIINTSFPKYHPLSKIFNRNTLKLSYSCMPNLKSKIDKHNKSVYNSSQEVAGNNNSQNQPRTCNCRNRQLCPLDGNCLSKSVVYQATVTTQHKSESYVGLTETEFKTRYTNHKASFNHSSKRNTTELSKYIWQLKDSNTDFELKWNILEHAKAYSNNTKLCNLCTCEKYYIIYKPQLATLNKRTELVNTCRHAAKFLLKNT